LEIIQLQAERVGRSAPESLTDTLAWARDNFAVNMFHIRRWT